MYIVDANNGITRVSDSKVIARDITTKDYRDFMFELTYRAHPDSATVAAGPSTILYPVHVRKETGKDK